MKRQSRCGVIVWLRTMPDLRAPALIVRLVMAFGFASTLLQSVTIGALAYAANPDPDTMSSETLNADGTVTVRLSGTWSWAGQNCEGRYGEGWAVDWWGISISTTPNPSFSLTNATVVKPAGVTTTGTVSPAGSIKIPKTSPTRYFHLAQYYAGEDVNSPATCTDTGTGGSVVSSGPWSASATYPALAYVPPQLCVHVYDEHGKVGTISTNATDFNPIKNADNSTQTNAFNPSSDRYCVKLTPPAPTSTPTATAIPTDTPTPTSIPTDTPRPTAIPTYTPTATPTFVMPG